MMRKATWIAVAASGVMVAVAVAAQQMPERTQDAAWYNRQELAIAQLKAEDGWRGLPGNIRWRRIAGDGSGKRPTVEDTVTLHYAGTLVDGTPFDSSYERGAPATFPLARLIKGWQIAVPQMGVGDTIEVAIPAAQAYGPVGRGAIPGGATLLFKIELIGIE